MTLQSPEETRAGQAPSYDGPHPPRRTTGRPRVAAAIAVATWVLAVVSVVLLLTARPALDENLLFFVVDVMVACVYGTVAAVILGRRSHPVPWLLALAAVGGGLAAFGFAYDAWAWQPGGVEPHEQIATLSGTAWMPGTFALFLVVPWLVRDHALGRAAWAIVPGAVIGLAMPVVSSQATEDYRWWIAVSVVLGLLAAADVERRRRTGPVEERNGLGWLSLGTAILAVSFLPLVLPWGTLPIWVTPSLHLASQSVFPAAVLVAVLRNRMWGLGLAISRAVLAGLLTAALIALYVTVTLLLAQLLPGDGVPHVVAAAAVAVAVLPLSVVLGGRVDRLVYGEASRPAGVVRRLGSQLVGSQSLGELLSGLAEDLGRSMRLESVTIRAQGLDPVRWGGPTGAARAVTLRHRGEEVGALDVTALPGEQLSGRDLAALEELGAVVAAAVAVARAAADVEELRARLAAARLEERRVIRREIHDGLGPSLAGLRLGLQGARNLLDTDPPAARELLGHLQAEIDASVTAVRSLSHHLLPPVLDELGLGAALAELAARWTSEEFVVTVESHGLGGTDLDPGVAAAAYAIVSEATTNAARHARAAACRISVRRSADRLVLEVADDGVGMPAAPVAGVGTRSMRERADEQGGRLLVTTPPGGGTVVHAVLPLSLRREDGR